MNFLWALIASITVSIISLIGIFSLLLSEKLLKQILIFLVGFGAGGLIGGAFLHLLPEAMEHTTDFTKPFVYVITGFVFFFILEKYLYWHHCHKEKCEVHTFVYLNLIGDGIHNFIDGLIIGASFMTNIRVGLAATSAIILHEVPQELGDFGILVYGGFSRTKALFCNLLSASTAIIGTIAGYYLSGQIEGFSIVLLSFAAGGFIYIASCDLIPELHKQPDLKSATLSMLLFVLGILLMFWLKSIHHH
jgi:zinc and cadmium transporter